MKIELDVDDLLEIGFKDSDGEIFVSRYGSEIKITTDWPDSSGRKGIIYHEDGKVYLDKLGQKAAVYDLMNEPTEEESTDSEGQLINGTIFWLLNTIEDKDLKAVVDVLNQRRAQLNQIL